jgi:bifunctional N-acetylglucosamine-1-phosphate-uridyltransferase/glucosamine-1-phosphate-acetyltransferase GlmU-like protein
MNEYASNGTYYFKTGKIMKKYFSKLMSRNIKIKNEYYVSMAYNLMIEDKLNVSIFEIKNMLQWGTPYDLEVYNSWSHYFNNIIHYQELFIDRLNTTLILPMAGAGSRFSIKNYANPKPLIDVNGLPMVIQAVNCLPTTSNKIFICLHEHLDRFNLNDTIKSFYNNTEIYGIDKITDGQACTCEIGINKSKFNLEDPILISACDNGIYYDVNKYQQLVDDITNDVIIWSFRNNPTSKNNPNMYAWLQVDKNDNILNVSCKKFDTNKHNIKTSHVIIGTMFFRKAKYFMHGLLKNYKDNIRSNNEFYVDDIINQNIKMGLKVKVFEVKNYICWGTPDDYETYIYWRNFFDKCNWHIYKKKNDITYVD